jgi:hypothetical protein
MHRVSSILFLRSLAILLTMCGSFACHHPTEQLPSTGSWVIAKAGWDCASFVGSYVVLNGSYACSSDIDTIAYEWKEDPSNPALLDPYRPDPQQLLGFTVEGNYRLILRVRCRDLVSEPDSLLIRVGPRHQSPFGDPKLEMLVRFYLQMPMGDPTDADYAQVDSLVAGRFNQPITSLEGIDHCTNLAFAQLSSEKFTDLRPLSGLKHIEFLWVDQTHAITDVSPLASLTTLKSLNLMASQITDISSLAPLTNLTYLTVSENNIVDVSVIANFTKLEKLDLSFLDVSDLSPLRNMTKLRFLTMWYCQAADLSPLAGKTELVYLCVPHNNIVDISPLSNCTGLVRLYLDNNKVVDVSPVRNMTQLSILGLALNKVTNILPLIENVGILQGDAVGLFGNPLDTTSVNQYIPQLRTRGVYVLWP